MPRLGNSVCPFTNGKFAEVSDGPNDTKIVHTPVFRERITLSRELFDDLPGYPAQVTLGFRRWIADMIDLGQLPPVLTNSDVSSHAEHPTPSPEVRAYRLLGWMVTQRTGPRDPARKFDFGVDRVDPMHEACLVTESEDREQLRDPLRRLQALGYVEFLGAGENVVSDPGLVVRLTSTGRRNAGRLPERLLQELSPEPLVHFSGELLAGVQPDNVQGPDRLGIERDASSFARVIADRRLEPPLAIGLFGDWGSGKSHFMYRIQQKILEISGNSDDTFCQGIVQVEFNAWHYVEANLWASLVDNILNHLHERLSCGVGKKSADEIFKNLKTAKRIHEEMSAELSAAKRQVKKLESEIEEKNDRIQTEFNLRLLLSGRVWSSVEFSSLSKELQERVYEIKERLGPIAKEQSPNDLWDLACTTGGRLSELWLSFSKLDHKGKRQAVFWLIVMCFAVVAVPAFVDLLTDSFISQAVASTVAVAVGGVPYIKMLLTKGHQTIALAQSVRDALQSANEQEITTLERELSVAEKRVSDAKIKVDDAQATVDSSDPRTMISKFIEKRVKSDDYARHLGLVAMIRRDFESLEMHLEYIRKQDSKDVNRAVDRIVLYIDDLDRCPSDKVVQVLEAIHLLLTFKLFVVVVGVDVRWIENALLDHYRTYLKGSGDVSELGASSETSVSSRATPHDYLEKIFQIPFWLEPVDKQAARGFLSGLTASSVATDASSMVDIDGSVQGPSTPGRASPDAGTAAADFEDVDREDSEARYDPLHFESEEREFLIDVGASAMMSPRRLKRFLNTYRVIKAGLTRTERTSFVRNGGRSGEYRAVLVLLAVATGYPWFARKFGDLDISSDFGTAINELMSLEAASRPEFDLDGAALVALRELAGEPEGVEALRIWLPRVSRFTFDLGGHLIWRH